MDPCHLCVLYFSTFFPQNCLIWVHNLAVTMAMAKCQNGTKLIPLVASQLSKYKCHKSYLEYLWPKISGIEWVFVITSNLTINKVTMTNCRAIQFERRSVNFPVNRGLSRRDKNERKERDLRSLSPSSHFYLVVRDLCYHGICGPKFPIFFRNFKQEQCQIRLNLVISIAIAQILFLTGIDATSLQVFYDN